MTAADQLLDNPFPGLRPFGADEAGLFFGRERQGDELLRRLARQRLLAVVGTSGSGKSSLVHAGLVPALEAGFMAAAGTRWRMLPLRPQSDPLGSLAAALQSGGALATMDLAPDAARGIVETTLRRSRRGLVDAARLLGLATGENLMVFVDQFEELFRYAGLARERGSGDDAAAFVQLLLQAVQQDEIPLYVVLTMRSDFLGDCARFRGLPEAISDGQYLIPRLSRDELRLAITGPVGVHGGHIDDALVQRLLNDVGDDPDQLPLLQHLLMRAWDHASRRGAPAHLKLDDLEAIGGLSEALSRHADEAWHDDLDDAGRDLAARVFRCLCERAEAGREVRRPTALATLQAITGASAASLRQVIDVFRAPGRSFLMPPVGTALDDHTEVDISHESLIRQWQRLRGWVQAEWDARTMLLRLVQAAELERNGHAGLWEQPALGHAQRWIAEQRPVAAWAERYAKGLDDALDFVVRSATASQARLDREAAQAEAERRAAERELEQARELAQLQSERAESQRQLLVEQTRRQRQQRGIYAGVTLFLLAGLGAAVWAWQTAQRAEQSARASAEIAYAAKKAAVDAELETKTVNAQLTKALADADMQRRDALDQKQAAETALAQAKLQRERADAQASIAEDRLARMKAIIARVPDPLLRAQLLLDFIPGATPELTQAQQRTVDAKSAAARADEPGPRVPQPPGYKLWRNGSVLRLRFLGGTAADQALVRSVTDTWSRHANLRFRVVDAGDSEIRVAFKPDQGSWAFVGIDALGVAQNQPTVNLGFRTLSSALHEFGHVLGLIHETANPNARLPWNRDQIMRSMTGPPNFWTREQIEQNFFRQEKLANYRPFDVDSVMMYAFPDSQFNDGVARGRADPTTLSDGDKAYVAKLYPPDRP